MIHRPFLRSAIQVVRDFRIGDFDLQSNILAKLLYIPFWRMPMIYNAMSFFKLLVNLTYGCYEGVLRLG